MNNQKFKKVSCKLEREPDNKWRFRHMARLVVVISGVIGLLILVESLINGFL